MNKMDITIAHIRACKTAEEAYRKITKPIEGFGYNLTKNEITLCLHYMKLYFENKTDKEVK